MVTPYIVFKGSCAQALAFYSEIFATQPTVRQCYGEYVPEASSVAPDILSQWIMHAEMEIAGTPFWFADDVDAVDGGSMVKLTVRVPDREAAQRIFEGLSCGGTTTLPPTETFYSSFHAAATDRYGVGWNIVAEQAPTDSAT